MSIELTTEKTQIEHGYTCDVVVIEGQDEVMQALAGGPYYVISFQDLLTGRISILGYSRPGLYTLQEKPYRTRDAAEADAASLRAQIAENTPPEWASRMQKLRATPYAEWCRHYGYEDDEQARADYRRYLEHRAVGEQLFMNQ